MERREEKRGRGGEEDEEREACKGHAVLSEKNTYISRPTKGAVACTALNKDNAT